MGDDLYYWNVKNLSKTKENNMKKQVNKINTEIVDVYLNEVEQCRMRMREAQKIADEKYKEIDDYTALLNKKRTLEIW